VITGKPCIHVITTQDSTWHTFSGTTDTVNNITYTTSICVPGQLNFTGYSKFNQRPPLLMNESFFIPQSTTSACPLTNPVASATSGTPSTTASPTLSCSTAKPTSPPVSSRPTKLAARRQCEQWSLWLPESAVRVVRERPRLYRSRTDALGDRRSPPAVVRRRREHLVECLPGLSTDIRAVDDQVRRRLLHARTHLT
jgi:hypothetical protein